MKDFNSIMERIETVDKELQKVTTGANIHKMRNIRQKIFGIVSGMEEACEAQGVVDKILKSGEHQAQLSVVLKDALADCRITKTEAVAIRAAVMMIINDLNSLAEECERVAK